MARAALTKATTSPAWLILPVLSSALIASPAGVNAADAPKVVVTIKPVHSLVAGVMEGVAAPVLLIAGGGSPHDHALKPSQARALQNARVVFRVSTNLETFLNRQIGNLAQKAAVVDFDETQGLTLYKARKGGIWEGQDAGEAGHEVHAEGKGGRERHGHEGKKAPKAERGHGEHARLEMDPHLWLDPANAKRLTLRIAAELSRAYPTHADAFRENAVQLVGRLTRLDGELKTATEPLGGKSYIVFHDAYRYFEERYGLRPLGSVTVSPDRLPGARRLSAIRERIRQAQADCVFAEPQFEPKLVLALVDGTSARRGVLDPLGANLAPGADLYFTLMRNLASALTECLAPPAQN